MKKILIALLPFIVLSCVSKEIKVNYQKETYIKAIPIKRNKIDNLELKDNEDLTNKEINMYFLEKLNIKNIPFLTLDINYETGSSDALVIKEIDGNNTILLDFKEISRLKTIDKKIIFMVANKKYENLNIKLKNEDKIIDNTIFSIEKEVKGDNVFFMLVPHFLDEDTFIKKNSNEEELDIDIAYYEDNVLAEYNVKQIVNDKEYNQYFKIVSKGNIFKGIAEAGSVIKLELENGTVIKTIVENDNKWITYIPKGYKGIVKITQEIEKNGIKYITTPLIRKVSE